MRKLKCPVTVEEYTQAAARLSTVLAGLGIRAEIVKSGDWPTIVVTCTRWHRRSFSGFYIAMYFHGPDMWAQAISARDYLGGKHSVYRKGWAQMAADEIIEIFANFLFEQKCIVEQLATLAENREERADEDGS